MTLQRIPWVQSEYRGLFLVLKVITNDYTQIKANKFFSKELFQDLSQMQEHWMNEGIVIQKQHACNKGNAAFCMES